MKKLFLILFLLVAAMRVAFAQTNTTARPVTLDITSKSCDFIQDLRQVIYHDHVVVTNEQGRLACEQLTVIFPPNKIRHLERVQAETNVMIDYLDEQGAMYHVTAAKVVYVYSVINALTNETVTFTGNPKVKWGDTNSVTGEPKNLLTGEPIYYTRINGRKGSFHADNQQIHYEPPAAETNAAPVKLF